jgi:hypothetical protein
MNQELYKIHLEVAQEWGKAWHIVQKSIIESINKDMDKKYKSIEYKLNK